MDGNDHRKFEIHPILIGLIGVIAGAMMVATYQCITLGCCYYRRAQEQRNINNNINQTMENDPQQERERAAATSRRSTANIRLIPVVKYKKECKEETCCVCLCEFNEGEQIRVLPECLHLFHVVCIDMWLSSHYNCPLCRADTAPPNHVVVSLSNTDGVPPQELERLPHFAV